LLKKLVPGVALVIALTIGASACATSNVSQAKFESELQKKVKLTKAQADCIGKQVYKSMAQKDINKLYTAATEKDLPPGIESQFTAIVTNCYTKP
jgi:hypothetical protein